MASMLATGTNARFTIRHPERSRGIFFAAPASEEIPPLRYASVGMTGFARHIPNRSALFRMVLRRMRIEPTSTRMPSTLIAPRPLASASA